MKTESSRSGHHNRQRPSSWKRPASAAGSHTMKVSSMRSIRGTAAECHPTGPADGRASGTLPVRRKHAGGPMPAVVNVRDLTVSFGPVTAVDGVDLSVSAGGGIALVGRNGAGKSTTLRVLGRGVAAEHQGTPRSPGSTSGVTRRRPRNTAGTVRTSVALSPELLPGSTSPLRLVFAGFLLVGRRGLDPCWTASISLPRQIASRPASRMA